MSEKTNLRENKNFAEVDIENKQLNPQEFSKVLKSQVHEINRLLGLMHYELDFEIIDHLERGSSLNVDYKSLDPFMRKVFHSMEKLRKLVRSQGKDIHFNPRPKIKSVKDRYRKRK